MGSILHLLQKGVPGITFPLIRGGWMVLSIAETAIKNTFCMKSRSLLRKVSDDLSLSLMKLNNYFTRLDIIRACGRFAHRPQIEFPVP